MRASARPKQGARLASLRRAAGLTQRELARAVGETQQKALEDAQRLPRRQQDLVIQFVETLINQQKKAS